MSKIKLFTHGADLDGIGCTILAYLAFGRENVDVEYCDYKDVDEKVMGFLENNATPYSMYYVTDISVSEETAKEIDSRSWKEKIRLFDHHATALGLNQYDWCQVIVSAADGVKTSGTELFWAYLDDHRHFDHYSQTECMNLWKFVDIVRDYDTWRWKELWYEEGIVCKQMNDLFYMYGREKFIDWCLNQIHGVGFPHFSETDTALLEQKQKDIDRYVEAKDKQLFTQIDSFWNEYGVVFAEQYFSELGNRLCELHPELAYVAMIDISRGKVSYRTIREDLDVGGVIAHSFGGGGHQKAAGSTFDIDDIQEAVLREVFGHE